MRIKNLLFLATLALGGCASVPSTPVVLGHTVAKDPRLEADEMEDACPSEKWEALRAQEYKAFVILDAQIYSDDTVLVTKMRQSYPDASWETRARKFAKGIKVGASSVGSNLPTDGKVIVVFYDPEKDDTTVLVFARRVGVPAVGMTGAAKSVYLFTDAY